MRLVALALVALLLAPAGVAKSEPAYPSELRALVPAWLAEARALGEPSRGAAWWPEAQVWLDNATAAEGAGRFRIAIFQLETYHEVLLTKRLVDEAAPLGSDAERKSFVLQRITDAREDADAAWLAYRAKLHGLDAQLRSLQSIEKALYSADIATSGFLLLADHEPLARDFPRAQGFPEGYVLALVRATHTARLDVEYASDMLDAAVEGEGLPPRVLDGPWANLTASALVPYEGDVPPYLKAYEEAIGPARANGESVLALAIALAEQRAIRQNGMNTIFGDASSRGKDVVNDAARGMRKQLNNTTVDLPVSYGLSGVFTVDAIDRARYTDEFVARGEAQLGTVTTAWASLEHAGYVLDALAAVSPVEPSTEEKGAPGFGAAALVVAALAVALTRGARTRRR